MIKNKCKKGENFGARGRTLHANIREKNNRGETTHRRPGGVARATKRRSTRCRSIFQQRDFYNDSLTEVASLSGKAARSRISWRGTAEAN